MLGHRPAVGDSSLFFFDCAFDCDMKMMMMVVVVVVVVVIMKI